MTAPASFAERRLILVTRILRKRASGRSVTDDMADLRNLIRDQLRAEVAHRRLQK